MSNKRNHTLDLYKGIGVLAVVWIHVATTFGFSQSFISLYIRELTSYVVPVFYIISGYFTFVSPPTKMKIKTMAMYYVIFVNITILYTVVVYNENIFQLLVRAYGLSWETVGIALWYLKVLVLFQMVYYLLSKLNSKLFLISIITLILLPLYNLPILPNVFWSFAYLSIGVLFGKFKVNEKFKLPNLTLLFCLLLPFLLPRYNINSVYVAIGAIIIFGSGFTIEVKSNKLEFFTKNSLYFMFYQHFAFQILILYNVELFDIYLLQFVVVTAITSLFVYVHVNYIRKATNLFS